MNDDMKDILTGKKKAKKLVRIDLGKEGFNIHPGKLHRALGIAEDKPIPAEKLAEALKSKDPKIRRMAASAKGLEGMKK
jgi:hypothetical protein